MIRMSLDPEPVLLSEPRVKLSHTFSAPVSQSEQPPLAKPRPPIQPKNGLQPPTNSEFPLLTRPPPPPAQMLGKRRYSVGAGFKGVAKRRHRATSESQAESVLPSHFLLGGNIFDPLNLNSLLDEDVNRETNQETPKCSPLPSRSRDPVEILVPRDITDPLNLKGGAEVGRTAGVLVSPLKSRRRHRYRHHGGGEQEGTPARLFPPTAGLSVPALTRGGSVSASPLSCELNTAITCRDDVAPPPVLPRRHTHPLPGSAQKPANILRRRRAASTKSADGAPHSVATATTKFQTPMVGGAKAGRCGGPQLSTAQARQKDKHRYQYGNHCRYYGYHCSYGDQHEGQVGAEKDLRLRLLEADWFRDKRVLDIGCGAGHMTLALALRFNPAHILGVELDEQLVHAARQNIRHFLSHDLVGKERGRKREEEEVRQSMSLRPLPLSFRVSRGPLSAPPLLQTSSSSSSRFPNNITFIQGNYVSEGEAWPGRGQYDVITCLGVTKWVQLQSGDGGVARLFKRAYQSLSASGLFILEPQPWSSYGHSKRASDTTFHHFRTLRLRPEQFTSFLTDSVGFSSYRLLTHSGIKSPIYVFHKGPAHRK
ncbi:7SK snRNA methylphosphate capping enzyme [Kryptolebias marmoratus]|uniref:RNA methyltransferase n=1 Tax=Kryptolebias marmoratus TaxID=37003 RepID=A0A3Q3A0Z1_KRYMA|nr:7SK snRNA methylphosphate capping enzyme [Kryptolebias marmoratus]